MTKTSTKIKTAAMINSECTHTCIGEEVVRKKNIPTQKLAKTMIARNTDGTMMENKQICYDLKGKLRLQQKTKT
jgi:hypothetical protein